MPITTGALRVTGTGITVQCADADDLKNTKDQIDLSKYVVEEDAQAMTLTVSADFEISIDAGSLENRSLPVVGGE